MEPQKSKTTAKDFFLHFGAMVALYWSVGTLLNLLYSIINSAFPQVNAYYGVYGSISFPVASLIVVFPVFIVLSWLNQKSYALDSTKKDLSVRRWIAYITLFLAGAILVASLVSILYLFLDGQELTTAFILKALSWFIVAGLIFAYYIQDIREKIFGNQRKVWAIVALLVVLISIILGFLVTGSPRTQQLMRYDDRKVADLQNIQNQVISYWQSKSALPQNLSDLKDSLSYNVMPVDPQTGASYVYTKKGDLSFTLCAEFNRALSLEDKRTYGYDKYMDNDRWFHEKGYQCFERTVDPERYPPFPKPTR